MFWKRKRKSEEFVELSVGKVYFYQLTKRIIDKVELKAITSDKLFSVPKYLQEMERELTCLSKSDLLDLNVKDANALRFKVREILIEANLLTKDEIRETPQDFSKKDIEWFDNAKDEHIKKFLNPVNRGTPQHGR